MVSTPLWSTPPATYRALITLYEKQFNDAITRGDYLPYVWPYRSFGVYLALAYLLLPPTSTQAVFYARYTVFAFLVYWSLKAALECRSATFATAYGIGLLDAWAVLWFGSLIIFNDARGNFKRIEKVEDASKKEIADSEDEEELIVENVAASGSLRSRHTNGSVAAEKKELSKKLSPIDQSFKKAYTWQPLPSKFSTRLNWVCDLVSNFRLLGWSHQILPTPSPPSHVLAHLQPSPKSTPPVIPTGISRYSTARAAIRKHLKVVLLGYLALDVLKVLMMYDPYFWGFTSSPPPSYLPTLITTSPVLTRIYRLTLSCLGAYTALQAIFALAAPFFISLFGERYLGPRAEPWQYPDHYGSYSIVFRKGLAGWWGAWWHQTFRFAFEAPQKWVVRNLGWKEKSMKAKVLGLVVAFVCSGCLHAAGSATMWPATRPLKGPFTFFILQPLGIWLQMALTALLDGTGLKKRSPGWIRGLGNFLYVHVWFYWTAPLLTDDFARGGVWLFEPIPVSILRGLGLGLEGEGWWCWKGKLVGWYTGERWWQSGIAI